MTKKFFIFDLVVILSLNIIGTNVYNSIPMSFPFESIKDSLQFIRSETFHIMSWSHENCGIKSNCKIAIKILEINSLEDEWWDWEFILNCKNIREFRPYIKLSHEDFDSLKKQEERDQTISEILE